MEIALQSRQRGPHRLWTILGGGHHNRERPRLDTPGVRPQNHAQIALLSDPVVGYMHFGSISPDSKWLATWNRQETVIWNTQTWEIEHRLNLPDGQSIAHGFVRDTYWYADLDPTGELRIWDLILLCHLRT